MGVFIIKLYSLIAGVLLGAICMNITACNANMSEKENSLEEIYVKNAKEQNMDEAVLSKINTAIKNNYPNVNSYLIARNGQLVFESYYNGQKKDDEVMVYSITKSVTSALIGIAIKENLIKSTDQKIMEFFPEYYVKNNDKEKMDITIKHALTMTAGLTSSDDDYNNYIGSRDWFAYTIGSKLISSPGEKFEYNTGLAHLLSGIISKTSGMSTKDFANKYLFNPIGVNIKRWDTDPLGYNGGGSFLYIRPIDMLKFGILYLNNGNFEGKQIIPEDYVKESVKPLVSTDNNTKYGYLWWISNKNNIAKDKTYMTINANGYGGQKITIVPELDIVVVITSDPNKTAIAGHSLDEILIEYVFESVKK